MITRYGLATRRGLAAAAACVLLVLAPPAGAATFTVNSTTDAVSAGPADGVCDADLGTGGNQCSIREALKEEAAIGGQDDVTVPAGTYPVSQFVGGPLAVADDARVVGAGAGATEIFATGGGPIFHVNSSAEAQLRDLTLRDGHGAEGGAVHNAGSLVVDGSVLRANRATRGGAIWSSGPLRVANSTIRDNRAESATSDLSAGGGIYTTPGGSLEIVGSELIDNTVVSTGGFAASGGGVFSNGQATVTESVFRGNQLSSTNVRRGGGLLLQGASTLTRSTVELGTASLGGGVYVSASGSLSATGSTLFGNQASLGGGGIAADGSVVLSNSTMTFNFTTGTPSTGGGVHLASGGSLGLVHATMVENLAGAGDAIYSNATGGGFLPAVALRASVLTGGDQICAKAPAAQSFFSLDFNVVGDATCGTTMSHDRPSTDPRVGQLAANGGPTQTHALLADSPAIDLVTSGCPPPATDQRGVARPAFSSCDAGAYELSSSGEGEPPPTGNPPGPGDTELRLELRVRPKQRLRRLAVIAMCPQEACEVEAAGRVVIRLRAASARVPLAQRKRFRLRTVAADLDPGVNRKLRMRLTSRKARRRATRLLDHGARGRALIDVGAQDAAGNNSDSSIYTIRLKP